MPLSPLQSEVLRLLAAHRGPDSDVAGATVRNQDGQRYSEDIDLFHDREEAVACAAEADLVLLRDAGFTVEWLRREPGIHVAAVGRGDDRTRLEWARDSDFRFFPTMPDPLFGFRLHVADLATHKALAAAGRREPRDVLDLLWVHERHLPLGAVLWAAVATDPGYSPECLLAEIGRNARYRDDDYADLRLDAPVDAGDVPRRFRSALAEAEAFIQAMPAGQEGVLFLRDGVMVQPDPGDLSGCVAHEGRRLGHWPSSSEIGAAMLGDCLGEITLHVGLSNAEGLM